MTRTELNLLDRDRLMVICDPGGLSDRLRQRYPQYDILTADNYLSAIAQLADRPARGLLVGLDPGLRKMNEAIAGLRKAAGKEARLIICCPPAGEPTARKFLSFGADDYIIHPPDGAELDHSLALSCPETFSSQPSAVPAPSWGEINQLAEILAGIGDGRESLLKRVCQLIAQSLRTANVKIELGGDCGYVGDPATPPAVVQEVTQGEQVVGRISLGTRQRQAYTTGELDKLRHYSRLIAHLASAASQQQKWQSLAFKDETSGLPNRRYFLQALERLLQRAQRERFQVTVLLFDLDGFKHFNDTYGHDAGDQIIRETGALFRRCCRQHDIVARYGGDEFVVVFWDAEEPRVAGSRHPRDMFKVLRRFKKALKAHHFDRLGPEASGCITISGGLATFPWDAQSGDSLITQADQALLHAKRDGKNRIYLVGHDIPTPSTTVDPGDI